ncbi:M23 family peptidase [Apilactobacillus timberlakei]|nr:M23 family peptidase [Apilactobacillus timberlakei]
MGKFKNTKRTAKSFAKMGKRTFKIVKFLVIHWYLTLILLAALLCFALFFVFMAAMESGSNSGGNSSNSSCPTVNVSSVTGSSGAWTKKGTQAYNLAKKIFAEGKASAKFNNIQAAIEVGNTITEGAQWGLPDTAEGHFGHDPKTNGVASGVTPIPSNSSYKVGGGGIFQITPFTNYAPIRSQKWLDTGGQLNFLLKEKAPAAATFKSKYKNDIPSGTEYFMNNIEVAGDTSSLSGRQSNAQKAYQMFSSISGSNGASDAMDAADSGADAQANACGGGGTDADATGNFDKKDWVYPIKAKAGIRYGQTDSGFNVGDQSFSGHRDTYPNQHDGFDFGTAKYSNPIRAAHSGTVIMAGTSPFALGQYNSYMVINGGGIYQIYQEFGSDGSGINVKKGQQVKSGQTIGQYASGSYHMHFGLTTSKSVLYHGSFSHVGLKDPITFLEQVKAKK